MQACVEWLNVGLSKEGCYVISGIWLQWAVAEQIKTGIMNTSCEEDALTADLVKAAGLFATGILEME